MSKFEWVLPLVTNTGKEVDYFKPENTVYVDKYMRVHFKDGSSSTFFTDTGDTYVKTSVHHQKKEYLMKPAAVVAPKTDAELAQQLRDADIAFKAAFDELTKRGYTMEDEDGDVVDDVFVVSRIYKETVL